MVKFLTLEVLHKNVNVLVILEVGVQLDNLGTLQLPMHLDLLLDSLH